MEDRAKKTGMPHHRDPGKTLEVLFEISSAVNTTRNLKELYTEIHHSLGKILNVENFYIAIHHEDRDSITFPYYVDEMDDPSEEIFNFSESASLTGIVINARNPCIFFEDDIQAFAEKQKQKTIGTVAKIWLGAPLIIRQKVIGVIAIQSYRSEKDYEKRDLDLLNSVSQHIALAIERKEADEKLREQRLLLEKILESSPVGIALAENRIFKWVNSEMVHMFGYSSKADFENQSVKMIYNSEQDYETVGNIISDDLIIKGKSDFEYPLKRKDNTLFSAQVMLASFNPSNMMNATIAIITDISEQKLAQQEKLEKEKLQGVLEMAGAVCHELNQPLQAILGYSSLLETVEGITGNDLISLRDQATRLGEITRRLSNITQYKSRDYAGKMKIVDIWKSDQKPN